MNIKEENELLDKMQNAPMLELIGGPWSGKMLPDMGEHEIGVLVGHTHHVYIKSDTNKKAYYLES